MAGWALMPDLSSVALLLSLKGTEELQDGGVWVGRCSPSKDSAVGHGQGHVGQLGHCTSVQKPSMPNGAGANVTSQDICISMSDGELGDGSRKEDIQAAEMRKDRRFCSPDTNP